MASRLVGSGTQDELEMEDVQVEDVLKKQGLDECFFFVGMG